MSTIAVPGSVVFRFCEVVAQLLDGLGIQVDFLVTFLVLVTLAGVQSVSVVFNQFL